MTNMATRIEVPILYDSRTNGFPVIWHKDPNGENLVRDIMEKLQPERFVETGTHMGWTDMWMSDHYPDLQIYTIEVDPAYFTTAQQNFRPYPNIHGFLGNSPAWLNTFRGIFSKGLTFFFLDAHFWAHVPLREECLFVASLDRYVALLDDFEVKDPYFGGDSFEGTPEKPGIRNNIDYVADIMGRKYWRPNYQSLPPYHKGYGLFLKGVDYTPPKTMKEEGA